MNIRSSPAFRQFVWLWVMNGATHHSCQGTSSKSNDTPNICQRLTYERMQAHVTIRLRRHQHLTTLVASIVAVGHAYNHLYSPVMVEQ